MTEIRTASKTELGALRWALEMSESVSQTLGSTPYSRGDITTSKDEERLLHGFRSYMKVSDRAAAKAARNKKRPSSNNPVRAKDRWKSVQTAGHVISVQHYLQEIADALAKKRKANERADFFENVRTGGRTRRRRPTKQTQENTLTLPELGKIKKPRKVNSKGVPGEVRDELQLDGILPPSQTGVVITPRSSYIRLCQEMKVLPDSRLIMRGDITNEYDFSGIQCNSRQMEAALKALIQDKSTSNVSLLNLSGNNFDQRAMEALVAIVGTLDLSDLDLSGNDVGQHAMMPLNKLMSTPNAELRELNLSQVGLSLHSMTALCSGLEACNSLRRLNLSHNALSNASLIKIAGALEGGTSLIELDLSWNRAKQAIEKFFQIVGLQSLNLAMNPISDDALGPVCPLLEDHNTLLHLDMSGTSIETAGLTRLAQALISNHVLVDIHLTNLKGCAGPQDSLGFVSVISFASSHDTSPRRTKLARNSAILKTPKISKRDKRGTRNTRSKRKVIRARKTAGSPVSVQKTKQRTNSIIDEEETETQALPKGGWLKLPHISNRVTRHDTGINVHYHGTIAKTGGAKARSCNWLKGGWSEITLEIRDTDVATLFQWHHDAENKVFEEERQLNFASKKKTEEDDKHLHIDQPKMTKEELDKIRLLPPLTKAMPEEVHDALHENLHIHNKLAPLKAGDLLEPDCQLFVHWQVDGYQAWGMSRIRPKRKRNKRKKTKASAKKEEKVEVGVWKTSRVVPPGRQHFFFSMLLDGVKVDCKQLDQRFILHKRYFSTHQTWVDGRAVESKGKESPMARHGSPRKEETFRIKRSLNFIDVMWRPGPFSASVCVPRPGTRMNSNNWDLMNSVFVERIKEADSRHFFDIKSVYARAFENDFRLSNSAAIITGRKSKPYDGVEDTKKLEKHPDVEAVRHVLKKQYKRIMDIFTYESAMGMALQAGKNTLQTWSWGTFSSWIRKIQIFHPKYLNHNDADIIFITCNVRVKSERTGPDRFLCRYEFLQLLLRLAMRRFVWSKKVKTIAEGLELTLRDHVFPNCKEAPDRDKWRRERLYTQNVSNMYNKHLHILHRVYDAWGESVDEALISAKDGSMSYAEWASMILATGLIVQTKTESPEQKQTPKPKRFGGKKRLGTQQKEKRVSSLRKKRMAAKQKRAMEQAEAEAENAEDETQDRYGNKLMKRRSLSEQHIRTSFIFSQMWVKNHNTTIKHKRMTFTDFLEGIGRVADAAYTVTILPKTRRADHDSSGSSSDDDDDDDDDIDLSIKLEDFLPRFIFPLVDKATKVVGGR